MCYETKRLAAAARFWAEALAADPKLGDDRKNGHRYSAACAAALAAGTKNGPNGPSSVTIKREEKAAASPAQGVKPDEIATSSPVARPHSVQGASPPPLSDAERAQLRDQARGWLEAELAAWNSFLASANREGRQAIAGTLKHWQEDADLAGVRGKAALAELPEVERARWASLWNRASALLARASEP
jgi:hypothetical protein